MTRKTIVLTSGIIIAVMMLSTSCTTTAPAPAPRVEFSPSTELASPEMISKEEALDIAKKRIHRHADYVKSLAIRVELQGAVYIVTFPFYLPPGTRGPDYAARVWIDAKTGAVLKILAGS